MHREGTQWWWYLNRFWKDDDNLDAADVQALVLQRELKKQKTLERARTDVFGGVSVQVEGMSPGRDESRFPSPSAMRSGGAMKAAASTVAHASVWNSTTSSR